VRRSLLIGTAIALTFATPASAATLQQAEGLLDYHAASGEKTVVTVTIKKKDLILTDPGAKIRIKNGDCTLVTKHKALCKKMADVPFSAELGNQSDSFRFKGLKNHFGTSDPEPVTGLQPPPATRSSIDAGPGNDSISGSPGGDLLIPGTGRDRVDGGDGDDAIHVTRDKSNDRLLGGRGVDTIEVTGRKAADLDLDAGELTFASEDDLLDGFERAQGGDGNDTLVGSDGADALIGGGGKDTIRAGGGDDLVDAADGSGGDTVDCGLGNDLFLADPGDVVSACERGP
jgi:Ca2+-binding RTX toxin-like protein